MSIWQTLEQADKLATLEINSWSSAITDPIWQIFSNIPIWVPMYVIIVAFIIQRLGWKKGLIVVAAAAPEDTQIKGISDALGTTNNYMFSDLMDKIHPG